MAKMEQVLRTFRQKMQTKYGSLTQPKTNNAIPEAGYSRFTGYGSDGIPQPNKPAGIVHEDEFVVSAPKVKELGGPEAVAELTGQPAFRRGGYVRGYQTGGSVEDPNQMRPGEGIKEWVSRTKDVNQPTSNPPPVPVTENQDGTFDLDPIPEPKQTFARGGIDPQTVAAPPEMPTTSAPPPAEPKPGATPTNITTKPPTIEPIEPTKTEDLLPAGQRPETERAQEFQALGEEQTRELERIAAGKGRASGLIGDISRERLASQLAASGMAEEQARAQAGLTGGALSASRARQRRDDSLKMTGLEGQLAIDAVNRAEDAVLKLADIAQRGEAFEEMKRQFGDTLDLQKANFGLNVEQFNEFKKQFNDQLAMQMRAQELEVAKFDEAKNQFQKAFGLDEKQFEEFQSQFKQTFGLETEKFNEAKAQFRDRFGLDEKQLEETTRQFDIMATLDQAKFDEAKSQFMQQFGLDEAKFDEMKRQYDESLGLESAKFNEAKAQFSKQFGLDEAKFDEMTRQFDETLGLSKEEADIKRDQLAETKRQYNQSMEYNWNRFQEDIRQFDENTAITRMLNDVDTNRWKADSLMLAGDFDAAAKVYEQLGINVDFTNLKERQNQQTFGNAITNLNADIDLIPPDMQLFDDRGKLTDEAVNTNVAEDLMRAWNAQNPDKRVDKASMQTNGDFQKWASNTFKTVRARKDPVYSMLNNYTPESKEAILYGVTDADGDQLWKEVNGDFVRADTGEKFEFGGIGGSKGLDAAITSLMMGGGLTTGPNGNLVADYDHAGWQAFGQGPKAGAAPTRAELPEYIQKGEFPPEDVILTLKSIKPSKALTGAAGKEFLDNDPNEGYINLDGVPLKMTSSVQRKAALDMATFETKSGRKLRLLENDTWVDEDSKSLISWEDVKKLVTEGEGKLGGLVGSSITLDRNN